MDTIADILTALANAQRVGKKRVAVPYSDFAEKLCQLFKERGLVAAVRVQSSPRPKLVVTLAYEDGQPRMRGARRLSSPGQRRYAKRSTIPYSRSGRGTIIVSTSRGLMEASRARQEGLGGELVCEVW